MTVTLPLPPDDLRGYNNVFTTPPTNPLGDIINALNGNTSVVQTVATELLVNFSTTATVPAYVTLLTLPITTVLPVSFLDIRFSAAVRHTGGVATKAINFRVLVDAVVQIGGVTVNTLNNQIQPVTVEKGRVPVTAGLHTVVIQIAKFGAGQTLVIDPATLPDLNGATLVIQEVR